MEESGGLFGGEINIYINIFLKKGIRGGGYWVGGGHLFVGDAANADRGMVGCPIRVGPTAMWATFAPGLRKCFQKILFEPCHARGDSSSAG